MGYKVTVLEGSSPLTRGAQLIVVSTRARGGLIPAHAGSTPVVVLSCGLSRAHPRSRGEHNDLNNLEGVRKGSSPLTRGAPLTDAPSLLRRGLIPAHAGSTFPLVS